MTFLEAMCDADLRVKHPVILAAASTLPAAAMAGEAGE